MALNLEWQHRILGWRQELSKHIYQPLGDLKVEAAFTFQQLTLDEALTQLDLRRLLLKRPGARNGNMAGSEVRSESPSLVRGR